MTPPRTSPNRDDASRILTEAIGGEVERIERFTTGLAHYVYDARLADGRRFVVVGGDEAVPELDVAARWVGRFAGRVVVERHHGRPAAKRSRCRRRRWSLLAMP